MKKILLILILFTPIISSCKIKVNNSSAVTWTVSKNGHFSSRSSFTGDVHDVTMATKNLDLTVNNQQYGKVQVGDQVKSENGKVYVNGTERPPLKK